MPADCFMLFFVRVFVGSMSVSCTPMLEREIVITRNPLNWKGDP